VTRPGSREAEFAAARERHGWRIGRFVVMPDHVHFFCMSDGRRDASSLSRLVGAIKEWTAKQMVASGAWPPIRQKQFFDHLLRSEESYADKWTYVYENPVRAGLVAKAEDWPHAGEIETLEQGRRSPSPKKSAVGARAYNRDGRRATGDGRAAAGEPCKRGRRPRPARSA
jgi:putative transposase